MMTPEEHANSTVYWATCFDCLTSVTISADSDADTDLPDPDEWDGSFSVFSGRVDCPVCGSSLPLSSDHYKHVFPVPRQLQGRSETLPLTPQGDIPEGQPRGHGTQAVMGALHCDIGGYDDHLEGGGGCFEHETDINELSVCVFAEHISTKLAHAGILRDEPENNEPCPCGEQHTIESLMLATSNGGPWEGTISFDIPNLRSLSISLSEADLKLLLSMLSALLPHRDTIARAIFNEHNKFDADYDGIAKETSLAAADAVLALLKGIQ